MKKFLSLILVIITLFSLYVCSACNNNDEKEGIVYDNYYRIKTTNIVWADEEEKSQICDGREETSLLYSLHLTYCEYYFIFNTDGTVIFNEGNEEKTYFYEIKDKDILVFSNIEKMKEKYKLKLNGNFIILIHEYDSEYQSFAEITFETINDNLVLSKEYVITNFKINFANDTEKAKLLDGDTEDEYKQSLIRFLSPIRLSANGRANMGEMGNTSFYTQNENVLNLYMDQANKMYLFSLIISKNKLTVENHDLAGYQSTLSYTYVLQ